MRLSPHTAQANYVSLLLSNLHNETLVSVPTFILPVLPSVPEVFRVDVGIPDVDYLHVAPYLHPYLSFLPVFA